MKSALIIGVSAFLILMIHSTGNAAGSKEQFSSRPFLEESGNMVLPSDSVFVGEAGNFSSVGITVGGVFYSFCQGVKVFNHQGAPVPFNDLEAAEEVKLFIGQNSGCVRKINVMRFAE